MYWYIHHFICKYYRKKKYIYCPHWMIYKFLPLMDKVIVQEIHTFSCLDLVVNSTWKLSLCDYGCFFDVNKFSKNWSRTEYDPNLQHESYYFVIMDASLMLTSFQRTGQELSMTQIYKSLVIWKKFLTWLKELTTKD